MILKSDVYPYSYRDSVEAADDKFESSALIIPCNSILDILINVYCM